MVLLRVQLLREWFQTNGHSYLYPPPHTMAPLEPHEKNRLLACIVQELSATPYACFDLEPLLSGTTNFTFRGHLATALAETDEQTVIIKHTTSYAALNKDFPVDISRCVGHIILILPLPLY